MYHPIEGLACIQERAINTASIVDKVVNSFSEAIQCVHCGALAFKAELVMRSGQVMREDVLVWVIARVMGSL